MEVWIVVLVFALVVIGIAVALYSRRADTINRHPIEEPDDGDSPVLDQRGTRP